MVNKKYFLAPLILVSPTIIVALLYALTCLITVIPLTLALWFYMFYALPPALVGHLVGSTVLASPMNSMISVPNGPRAWLFIFFFYLFIGIIFNLVFRIRLYVEIVRGTRNA